MDSHRHPPLSRDIATIKFFKFFKMESSCERLSLRKRCIFQVFFKIRKVRAFLRDSNRDLKSGQTFQSASKLDCFLTSNLILIPKVRAYVGSGTAAGAAAAVYMSHVRGQVARGRAKSALKTLALCVA